jgi:asparagine synthase (glutamine-hydrolysing)
VCGIALVLGARVDDLARRRFHEMAEAVSPRGEVLETEALADALLATSRLRIVDRDRAVQPWRDATGRYRLNYNGEIFNYAELRDQLIAEGRPIRSASDTEVALEAVLAWGRDALLRFRGEFALALTDLQEQRVFVARDPAGIKPLYWARSGGRLFLASEVKALVGIGARIEEIAPGHCGWITFAGEVVTEPYIDLLRLGEGEPMIEDTDTAIATVRQTLIDAIARRVDTDLPVGVILSGGLDSSIVATQVSELHPDCVAFTVGAPGSEDLEYARRLTADLGIEHVVVELTPRSITRGQVKEALRIAECTEYGDAINAVVSMEVFRAVHERGIKVAIVGDGSDELFGGYGMYQDVDADTARRLFLHKIRDLSRTELQRVDRTSMDQCVEARVPYLDLDMLLLSMRIPLRLKVADGYEKWVLRRAFADVLPDYILARHKNPMSHSSGLHERIRLYKPMMSRWYRGFGYGLHGPMHRDFSIELARAGNDFDAAVVAAARREDYTAAEHARDFAGALRWNVTNALRPGSSSRAGR